MLDELNNLPDVVKQYFIKTLKDRLTTDFNSVKLRQQGQLRTLEKDQWMEFSAREVIVADECSFHWKAKVKIPLGLHISVVDSFNLGIGYGQVKFLSLIPIGHESNSVELNSGALHRYLAEGVWCPTVLLPCHGVRWVEKDKDSAEATLTVGESTVSLVFRFKNGDVISVYSDGRFGKFRSGYQKKGWEGLFKDYREVNGIRIPFYGEVGWWENNKLRLVWKGQIVEAEWGIKNE
ncbi:DUF6920 family protein [Kangiella sp.]|uniref:DUF6920 family protein n=1 Tax=Kangiella sp. TaxID=1920245 RepID=UPI003A92E123